MPCKKIIVVIIYDLGTDDLWDVWEFLELKYSFDVFPALRKACRASEKFCFLVVFLQLRELKPHASNVGNVRTVKSYFASKGVPKLVQPRKDDFSAYEDLVERGKLTR